MKNNTSGLSKPVVIILITCFLGAAFHFGSRARNQKPAEPTPHAPTPASSTLVAGTGSIVVQTNPANAEVKVGDLPPQKSPFVLKEQKPGIYPVQITLQNHEDWTGEVAVTVGRSTDFAPELIRSTGDVLITGPAGAEVYIDKEKAGEIPLRLTKIPTGNVQYNVQAKGYTTQNISGEVTRNAELCLNAQLQKWSGPEGGKSWIVPSTGIKLLWVASGSLKISHRKYNSKKHVNEEGTISSEPISGFWLGQSEVTQSQWITKMKDNPSLFKGGTRPVENVTCTQIMDFCKKLNEHEKAAGRLPDGYQYSIPSTLQWTYACLAGAIYKWKWEKPNEDFNPIAWYCANSDGETCPIMKKSPNRWGFYDMYGNVSEICKDWEHFHKVGGGWADVERDLGPDGDPTAAPIIIADNKSGDIGFRLILSHPSR